MKIRRIIYPLATANKIRLKHGLTAFEINQAVMAIDAQLGWEVSEKHGGRLIVRTTLRDGRRLVVALAPVNIAAGVWRCITAYAKTRRKQ